MKNCEELIRKYLHWIGTNFKIRKYNDYSCTVTTPFLLQDGDPVEIFVQAKGDDLFKLSDLGYLSDYLFLAGIDIGTSEKRKKDIKRISSGRGLIWDNEELYIECSKEKIGQALHMIIGGFLTISELTLLSKPEEPKRPFVEVVKEYLDKNEKKYNYQPEIEGRSITHKFDFSLNTKGMKLVDTLSTTTKYRALEIAEKTAFKFLDVKPVHPDYISITVIDDSSDVWGPDALSVVRQYSDISILWQDRNQLLEVLK